MPYCDSLKIEEVKNSELEHPILWFFKNFENKYSLITEDGIDVVFIAQISHSKREKFYQCRWKFYLYYYLKVPEEQGPVSHLQFGSYIHRVFELGYQCSSVDELKEIASQERENYSFDPKVYPQSKIDRCLTNFFTFNQKLSPTVGVEVHAKLDDKKNNYTSVAILDRVVSGTGGGFLIIDYKTGKEELTKTELFNNEQGRLYVRAVSEMFNTPIKNIVFSHYYPLTGNFQYTKYLPWQLQENNRVFTRDVWEIRKMTKEQFAPTKNKYCDSCGYKDKFCPLFSPPNLVKQRLDEIKTISE